jgi:hypothetical protein
MRKRLNVVRKGRVGSTKLDILIGIEMPAKKRIRMANDDLWSKPRMRCKEIRSG